MPLALLALGVAAKAMARAYSPTLVNRTATEQNALCKALLDRGYASTAIMKDFGGNETYRQKWMDAAKRSRGPV